MESNKQPSMEIKSAASQYQSSLNDDDLVDMNEIIQCNLANWNICDNETEQLVCSQEIKLESYNFLGTKINYEDDKFELDEFHLPDNYFKPEELNNYESEDEVNTEVDQQINGIINLVEESSDEDESAVVNLLNSSSETHNASNTSICPNLESIRSDHNYSSQEVFVGSPNETTETEPELATKLEPDPEPELAAELKPELDYVNEMQALIATWINDAKSSETKAIILNDLETEIKRIKSTMLDVTQEIMPIPDDQTPNGYDPNATDVSDDNENYMMSEGHSEPSEYRAGRCVLTETDENVSEQIDEEASLAFKNLRLVIEQISSKVTNFSKLVVNDAPPGDTAKTALIDLTKNGEELVKSIKAMAEIFKLDIGSCVDENGIANVVNANLNIENVDDHTDDKIEENVDTEINELVDGKVDENIAENVADKVVENVDDKVNENINQESDLKATESSQIESNDDDDKVVKKVIENVDVAEDKAYKLNDRSKQRWLASSSEDESSSDESISENMTVRRRKKRARTVSTCDEAPSIKNARKKNVLLDSSDDDASGKSVCSPAELDKLQSSEESELIDIDMSSYLLPSDRPTNMSTEDEKCDDVDKSEQRVDSELEEFFGFDGPTCDDIQPTFNQENVEPISEKEKDISIETDEPNATETDEPKATETDELKASETDELKASETDEPKATEIDEPKVTETDELKVTETDELKAAEIDEPKVSETDEPKATETDELNTAETDELNTAETDELNTAEIDEPKANDPVTTYVESQHWDLPDDPAVIDHQDNEIQEANLLPNNGIENDTASEDRIATDADGDKDNEENNDDEEEDSEYDTDEEINRLVDFSTIRTKVRPIVNHVPVYRKRSISKPKPKEDILDILKDSTNQDIESESSSEEDIISEEQYVLQLAKQQCLKDSSDDSDAADSDSVNNEGQSSIDEITDESNDSKLNRFLKKRLVNEMENDLEPEEKIGETAINENPVEDDADEIKSEPDFELESSGIFEPEIELHDGEKLSDKDQDSDADEKIEPPPKAPEEKKKWTLDKIAFNKNLFNNLDDLDEKNANAINSDNSDCEMLDISMFKTKKTTGDLDKIIQNQKKRDVSKTTKVADECISLSSDSDLEIDKGTIDDDSEDEKQTKSRPMLRNDQLAGETKLAQKEENDRLKRLEKKTERLTQIVESQSQKLSQSLEDSDVVLDFDTKRNCAISVHPEIVKNLKEHQIAGVKFMYDCCYGSIDSIDKHPGSGCILAHCMGLGKTLQLIALLHTLIRFPQLKTKKILVICPKSTIMNWADEISIWLRSVKVKLKVLHFPDPSDINKKLQILREWHSFKADPEGRAGCMLIGYEAFRSLVFYTERPKLEMSQVDLDRIKKAVDEYLLKPGADLVVCDEGHVIKNRKSTTSRAVNKISSRRRIILTGTPIQNNLKEYYSMVNFIKPSFLGTEKEFANLYENPIKEGQHKDSNNQQIRHMKQRSYVLHKKLSKFVQRREAALLKTFLPEKYEYVLFIPMTELQNRLYQHFLDNNPLKEKYGGKSLIPDYTFLRKIWTHPKVLENAWKNAIALRDKKAAARRRNMESDEEPDDVLDNQVGKMSVENDWWRQFIEPQDLKSLLPSNKLRILFEILKLCQQNGEKCLIFSAFVAVLDVVEYFMQQIHDKILYNDGDDLGLDNFHGPWQRNNDYYRLDGKTSKALRHAMIQNFNDPTNQRVKCFLISAKAGGQGINLVGANRVILLDTSWNPSNDQQNIFRVFRLGQQKKCYIYRLLAMGTMEEKVYSRSVTKQAMSFRVVDEQQIDRHYNLAELSELYTLTIPDQAVQPTPVRPVDNILASLLRNFKNLVYKYHEHDSLLENNSAEDLNEQEKADAWDAYEKDVSMKNQFGNMNITADGMYNNPYGLGMGVNMMNPFAYIPQNLPPSMVTTYLQRMGYNSGVEQELMLMSQMYSQFNQSSGSSSYGPLSGMFNSPSSGNTNPLYNSTSAANNYFKTSIPPITTSSPSSYTNIASNVFNGISPLSTASSSSAAAVAAAQYNLARFMPAYSGLSGTSNQASLSTSSRPSSSPIASPFAYSMYSSAASPNSAQQLATNQAGPGPNAIKNPLLSNLLPPSTSNTKDSFSIPTSVITKASKEVQRTTNTSISSHTGPTSIQVSRSANVMNQTSHQSSAHSSSGSSTSNKPMTSSKGNPLMVARASPLSSARGSPSILARSSPSIGANITHTARSSPSVGVNIQSTSRSSPSDARSNSSLSRSGIDPPNSLSITRSTMHKSSPNPTLLTSQLPLSITLAGNRTSPEPNIIVKDVTAINRTVERKSATTASSKTTTQPIKNYNMGIVYPKAPEKKSFDLSQNDHILKAAQNQLQQLNSTRTNIVPQNHHVKNRISLPQTPNRSTNRPTMTAIKRTNNVKGGSRTIDTSSTSPLSSAAKSHLSPNLPTNEVTITPTKRLQRLSLPVTAVNARKLTPSTMITPSTSQKQSIEMNKLNNNSALSVSRLPSSTSITRQIPIPTSSATMNKVVGRIQNPPQSIPKVNRPVSIPTLKLISQPSSSVQSNNKAGGISRPLHTTTAINRNQISRVVSANNGVSKMAIQQHQQPQQQRPQSNAADMRKVFTNPLPKLANFANSGGETRKRKLEELIPKHTGITLTKKSKTDNVFVQSKKVSPQRPREPSSSAVEIVELD